MTIKANFKAKVLSLSVKPSRDGSKNYYSVALLLTDSDSDPCGSLNISESIYKNLVVGCDYVFEGTYSDKYNNFYISGVNNAE